MARAGWCGVWLAVCLWFCGYAAGAEGERWLISAVAVQGIEIGKTASVWPAEVLPYRKYLKVYPYGNYIHLGSNSEHLTPGKVMAISGQNYSMVVEMVCSHASRGVQVKYIVKDLEGIIGTGSTWIPPHEASMVQVGTPKKPVILLFSGKLVPVE
jgi:hypothetical protein